MNVVDYYPRNITIWIENDVRYHYVKQTDGYRLLLSSSSQVPLKLSIDIFNLVENFEYGSNRKVLQIRYTFEYCNADANIKVMNYRFGTSLKTHEFSSLSDLLYSCINYEIRKKENIFSDLVMDKKDIPYWIQRLKENCIFRDKYNLDLELEEANNNAGTSMMNVST